MKKERVYEEIEVESYAGHQGEESPRAFSHFGQRYEVSEILDRWYEEGRKTPAPRHHYFKVRTTNGQTFLIRYTPRFQTWTLCRHVPAPKFSNN